MLVAASAMLIGLAVFSKPEQRSCEVLDTPGPALNLPPLTAPDC